MFETVETRSSAQGNCSEKSLADNVVDSSLSSLSSEGGGFRGVGWVGGGGLGRGLGEGRGVKGGEGQGTFHPPCHILHYHMVLRPIKGLRTTIIISDVSYCLALTQKTVHACFAMATEHAMRVC